MEKVQREEQTRKSLDELLDGHSELKEPILRFVEEIVRTKMELRFVDDIEDRMVPAGRKLMNELIRGVVQANGEEAVDKALAEGEVIRHQKKYIVMNTTLGSIELSEQTVWNKREGKEFRPFQQECGTRSRGYSRRLERAIVDFGVEESFLKAAKKMKEHYDVELPVSACRVVTLRHAEASDGQYLPEVPEKMAAVLIGEVDGSMVPLMTPGKEGDRRKGKALFWKEAKLTLVRRHGEVRGNVAATMGDAQACGQQLLEVAQVTGFGDITHMHGIGDGAPWIAGQFEKQFEQKGSYMVDIFHVCDYLAAVAKAYVKEDVATWLKTQKERLRTNQHAAVLETLAPHLEPENAKETPARDADRYLRARIPQLNYKDALAANLPIGSGEIESAHRYVIQERLKKPGAWWLLENAQALLNLRCLRHNEQWERYWNALKAA